MKKYKVITIANQFVNSKFNSEKVEQYINSFAQQEWQVISVTSADRKSGFNGKEELIIIMEMNA